MGVRVNSVFSNFDFCDEVGPGTFDSCLPIVQKFSLRGKKSERWEIFCCTAHPFVGEMMHGGVMVDWWLVVAMMDAVVFV